MAPSPQEMTTEQEGNRLGTYWTVFSAKYINARYTKLVRLFPRKTNVAIMDVSFGRNIGPPPKEQKTVS
jgi:hypothetical protein